MIGATLASGAALLPDIDHPSSTVSRTFGAISQGLSKAAVTFSKFIYRLTRTKKDSDRDGGHRGFTHTIVFALLMGLIVTAAVQASNGTAIAIVMFFYAGLAIRGVMHKWCPKRDAMLIAGASLVLTVLCTWWASGEQHNAAIFGLAVIVGNIAHFLGDAITEQGCSMLWPIPITGKTWYPIRPPKAMRMSTGGKTEMKVVLPILTGAAVIFSVVVAYRVGAAPWLTEIGLLSLGAAS
ncbi:membrane-bound metal-dependent hydrolase YbcI (DUF457 family) [Actinoalloteichus hymeniacidonis]|nr:membrane-bound metal-dependent hydrolase YbcI (DUF457 family) [Actinoalloteichus hymeniacidonis]